MTTPTTPPPPDAALDALAAAAAEHLAALDAPRAADDLSGLRHVGERLAASNALAAASVATARGLVAAVDALRAEQTDADALRRSWGVSFNSLSDLRTAVIGLASGAALPPPEVLDERHGPNVADALRKLDALRAAEARRDALAAAVRAERDACRRLPAHYDADYASSEERARVGALIDAHDAAEEHLTALLAAAPPRSTVPARLVREYLAAEETHWREINNVNGLHDPGRAGRCAATQGTRDAARAALDALLARCP